MDILSIAVRDDGTTIKDIKSKEEAEIILIELDFAIATLRTDLDDAWSDNAKRGIVADADWLTDTKAELREKEAARNALRIYRSNLKRDSKDKHERMRQTLLIESLHEVMTDNQWLEALTIFKNKFAAFESGKYVPKGWVNKDEEAA